MSTKAELQLAIAALKKSRDLLQDEGQDSAIVKLKADLGKARTAFNKRIEPLLKANWKEHDKLAAELREIEAIKAAKKYQPSKKLQEWLRVYTSGVQFGRTPEIFWASDDEEYVIVRYPGATVYGGRMSPMAYSNAEYELVWVTKSQKWTDHNKIVLMHTEGRLSKDLLKGMKEKAAEHHARVLDHTTIGTVL